MKNLKVILEANDKMSVMHVKVTSENLTSCQYAFMLYRLLLELSKKDKEDVLIAIDALLDDLKERGEL